LPLASRARSSEGLNAILDGGQRIESMPAARFRFTRLTFPQTSRL